MTKTIIKFLFFSSIGFMSSLTQAGTWQVNKVTHAGKVICELKSPPGKNKTFVITIKSDAIEISSPNKFVEAYVPSEKGMRAVVEWTVAGREPELAGGKTRTGNTLIIETVNMSLAMLEAKSIRLRAHMKTGIKEDEINLADFSDAITKRNNECQ